MLSLLLTAILSSAAATQPSSVESPVDLPSSEPAWDEPVWDDAGVEVSPARPPSRSGPRMWGAVGVGTSLSVWARPGLAPILLLGDHLAVEGGYGALGVRAQVSTVRMWSAIVGFEGSGLLLIRPGDDPLGEGVLFGLEGAAGLTALGNRYYLGPTIGLRGRTEARLTVAAVGVPRLGADWTSLGSTRYGVHVGLTLMGVRGR